MEILILVILIHVLILIYGIFIAKFEVLEPPMVFIIVWTISLVFYYYNYENYIQFGNIVYIVITIGSLIFVSSYTFYKKIFYDKRRSIFRRENIKYYINYRGLFILVLINILLCIVTTIRALALYNSYNIDGNILISLRHARNYNDFSFGILEYSFLASYFTTLFLNLLYHQENWVNYNKTRLRYLLFLSFIPSVINIILSTGRTQVLLLILGLLVTSNVKKISKRKLILQISSIVILFLSIFSVYSLIFNKVLSSTENVFVNLINNITFYFSSGIQSLDYFLNQNNVLKANFETFRSVYAALNKVGFNVEVPNLVKEFTPTPLSSNVYTVYELYINDFGFLGILIIQYFLGAIYAYVYFQMKNKKMNFVLFYAMFLYALILQPFQDQYFSLLSSYLQIILIITFFCKSNLFMRKLTGD